MKISSKYLLHNAAALLICASVASCADNEMATGERSTLQPGEYPLMLTASVGEMTSRSDGKESWAERDMIAVRIGNYPNVGCYLLNSDGTVMSAEKSIDWHTTELSTVTAWFPYIDLGQVKTVSIADQSQGFKEYDFLTAVEENQIYTNAVNLNFKHQMAKVSCKILPDDGISDAEWNTVKVSIGGFTKASFSNGVLSGDYADNNKWITPVYDAGASSDKMPVYEALVVPQDMRGKDFIKIDIKVNHNGTVIDKTLIYQPNEATADLKAGTHYSYSVIVQKDRLEVQSLSAEWKDDGKWHPAEPAVFYVKMPKDDHRPKLIYSNNVKDEGDHLLVSGNRFSISYIVNNDNVTKAFDIYRDPDNIYGDPNRDIMTREIFEDENHGYICVFNYYLLNEVVTLVYDDFIQIGDYYYDDGTWGPTLFKDVKTPIGVVFKIGAGGDDVEDTYNKGWKKIHGYAVAINDAVDDPTNWGSDQTVVETFGNATKALAIYSGYNHTKKIKQWGEENKKAYDAVKAVIDYVTKAPDSSSGWYLPTLQQLIDIEKLPDRARLFTDVGGEDVKPYTSTNIFYWSCLEVSSARAWTWRFGTETLPDKSPKEDKTVSKVPPTGYVRAVLTF